MVCSERLKFVQSRIDLGFPVSLHIFTNADRNHMKVRCNIGNAKAPSSQAHATVVAGILDILLKAFDENIVTDRGHRHSDGSSVVCFYVRSRDTPTPDPARGRSLHPEKASRSASLHKKAKKVFFQLPADRLSAERDFVDVPATDWATVLDENGTALSMEVDVSHSQVEAGSQARGSASSGGLVGTWTPLPSDSALAPIEKHLITIADRFINEVCIPMFNQVKAAAPVVAVGDRSAVRLHLLQDFRTRLLDASWNGIRNSACSLTGRSLTSLVEEELFTALSALFADYIEHRVGPVIDEWMSSML
eukprot:TRINITY_DN122018_c0_g1_i1.p1 TRINITY_DN122018_c0_g1~~TRINITY_DN122018_c0_g1_i1.p1  ORF type:complete len:305 (-),score=28.31 TRINITY_DN122018_c0_g1_i1:203-1117(-)